MEDIKKKIEEHIRKGKNCYIKLKNGNNRLLRHNPVLDAPLKKLPWLLSKLQEGIYKINFSETTTDGKVLIRKEFNFRDFDKAINIFLDGLEDEEKNNIVFLGR